MAAPHSWHSNCGSPISIYPLDKKITGITLAYKGSKLVMIVELLTESSVFISIAGSSCTLSPSSSASSYALSSVKNSCV